MYPSNVISLCCRKDLVVWRKASKNIIKYVESNKYTVIVPEADLILFKEVSPEEYTVVSELSFTSEFENIFSDTLFLKNPRYWWYVQQFIKLKLLTQEEFGLIWDADTVPLKRLSFERKGKVLYYKGKEYHKPYFDTIHKLLGIEKKNNFSFIAQCMPCKGLWANEFIKLIETKCEKRWELAIVDKIAPQDISGFSEYETLGQFILQKHPTKIEILNNKWQRYGNGLIGSIENLRYCEKFLSMKYDFISFETWDLPYSYYINTLKYFAKKALRIWTKNQ